MSRVRLWWRVREVHGLADVTHRPCPLPHMRDRASLGNSEMLMPRLAHCVKMKRRFYFVVFNRMLTVFAPESVTAKSSFLSALNRPTATSVGFFPARN
jgi:hypothetical protein